MSSLLWQGHKRVSDGCRASENNFRKVNSNDIVESFIIACLRVQTFFFRQWENIINIFSIFILIGGKIGFAFQRIGCRRTCRIYWKRVASESKKCIRGYAAVLMRHLFSIFCVPETPQVLSICSETCG